MISTRTPRGRNARVALLVALAMALPLLAGGGVSSAAPSSGTRAPQSIKMVNTPGTFRIGSFNVLGSWHTRAGNGSSHYTPGPMRAHLAAEAIRIYQPGVVGFQEAEPDQVPIMAAELPDYAFWPALTLDWEGVRNNIAWDKRRFTKLNQGTIRIVFLGEYRQLPYVHLQEMATGRQFWVLNVHNTPKRGSETFGAEERTAQLNAELAKVRELSASGLPVFMVGDFNDRVNTYCRVITETTLRAAQGPGTCSSLPQPNHIDWIFGSANLIGWSDYKYDRGPLLTQVTDHHVAWATATLR